MKVALVAQPYDGVLPPNQNSIGLIAYNTAMELARHIDVTLYAKRRMNIKSMNDLPFSLSFVSAGTDDILQYFATHYPRWAHSFGIPALVDKHAGYVRSIAKEIDRVGSDVVHVMNYWSWCQRLKKGRERHRGVVLEMQSEWLTQMDKQQISRALEVTDAVVTVSDHIARLFRESFSTYQDPVVTAYNGVNVETFRPDPGWDAQRNDTLTILFVGRVSPEKGVHTLIEGFARIASRFAQAQLVIVGPRTILPEHFLVGISSDPLVRALNRFYKNSASADYQHYLDDLVIRLGLGSKIRFLGSIPHKELVEWYRSSNVVVNPSLSESFGISIVEGMACSIPVVGTKVGGMLETVVDGETGLLVEPERPDLLAEAVISLLENPEAAYAMGVKGRSRAVERFSWRARADRLLSVYQMVLDQSRV